MASGCLRVLLLCALQLRGGALTALDPPENLRVSDPGYLGLLRISWSPPASLSRSSDCRSSYQLEYFDCSSNSWVAVRTEAQTYSALFDLMREVQVRVFTLLRGPCTNGTLVRSSNCTQLLRRPSSAGIIGTEPQNFTCISYGQRFVECTWERGANMSARSQQHLWFWYQGLGGARECPRYLVTSGGVRRGCNFTQSSLPIFTDINMCVNGSAPEGPLRPGFLYLQIQNHVKPEASEAPQLQAGSHLQLHLRWDAPARSRIPAHCLEWELEQRQGGGDRKEHTMHTQTAETSLVVGGGPGGRGCFRVRSRMHKYCAEKSFWSEWSHASCYGPGGGGRRRRHVHS